MCRAVGEALTKRVRSLMLKTLLRQEVAFFDRDENSPGKGESSQWVWFWILMYLVEKPLRVLDSEVAVESIATYLGEFLLSGVVSVRRGIAKLPGDSYHCQSKSQFRPMCVWKPAFEFRSKTRSQFRFQDRKRIAGVSQVSYQQQTVGAGFSTRVSFPRSACKEAG